MIWIIGGTTEDKEFIKIIKEKGYLDLNELVVSVATEDGREFLPGEVSCHVGKMDCNYMESFIKNKGITACVDLSHPHALNVSDNAKKASLNTNISYIRYSRKSEIKEDPIISFFSDFDSLFKYMENLKGTFFITTGVNKVAEYEKIKGNRRFIYRVLPSVTSMEIMKKYNILMEDIIGILGPVDFNLNLAMMKNYKADYLVMKDSGKESMTKERVDAARCLGMKVLAVSMKNEENALKDLNDVYDELIKIL